MASPDPSPFSLTIPLPSEAECLRLGARLAPLFEAGDMIWLIGALGAGKTTLARGAIQALCGEDVDIPSPTFALIQQYETADLLISHMDLYRLENPDEVEELGLDDALDAGACLIEWPDRLGAFALDDRLEIHLQSVDAAGAASRREARMTGYGLWARKLRRLAPPSP
ncbi:MAG: tRNA (adenosine(37)-N6)-threonylcarbamoyltransferase complex ATPase subunit type 1 TsaE [Pseudomonadota bacterium]